MKRFLEQEEQEIIVKLQHELSYMQQIEGGEEGCLLATKHGNRIGALEKTKGYMKTFIHLL
ncbi:hypothetical protein OCA23_26310 [Bacillus cereus]|nr:hypothetical protein [Bacillus cereus]